MKLNKKILVQKKSHHLEFYFTLSTEKHDINETNIGTYIRLMKHMRWTDFDHYVDIVKSIWKVILSKNCTVKNEEWITGMCNCPIFQHVMK